MATLKEGEVFLMKGSAKQPYVLQLRGGVYSCNCMAWRQQSVPIDVRTCKHLRKHLGDDVETKRIGAPAGSLSPIKIEKAGVPPLILAHKWENEDPTGWWISEKLDGIRAFWNGTELISRLGNLIHAPEWFKEGLPAFQLDGELWLGRRRLQETNSIVRSQDKSDRWKQIQFLVFDAPDHGGPFEARVAHYTGFLDRKQPPYAFAVEHNVCEGVEHLRRELARVEAQEPAGEGLMLRQPKSMYEEGRSHTLLKVKTFHDAEALVIGYEAGKGKHKGRVGSLICRMPNGNEFGVGTGMSDAERKNPPPIGTTITYRYKELTPGEGIPFHPSYVGVRSDI